MSEALLQKVTFWFLSELNYCINILVFEENVFKILDYFLKLNINEAYYIITLRVIIRLRNNGERISKPGAA